MIVFSIFALIVTFIVASSLQFWHGNGWQHVTIVAVFWVCLAILAAISIARIARKPQITSTEIQSVAQYHAPIPYWAQFIIYPLSWAYMLIWGYLLIIYGIKFGPEKQNGWLISAFTGIVQENLITHPVKVLVKIVLITFVFHLINTLFFDSISPLNTENMAADDTILDNISNAL